MFLVPVDGESLLANSTSRLCACLFLCCIICAVSRIPIRGRVPFIIRYGLILKFISNQMMICYTRGIMAYMPFLPTICPLLSLVSYMHSCCTVPILQVWFMYFSFTYSNPCTLTYNLKFAVN